MFKTKASLGVIAVTAITVMTLFLLPFTPKTPVRTAVVERGDLIKTTILEGVVAYRNQQPVVSLQAGQIGAVYVGQGDAVKKGQLLLSMDSSVEENALASVTALLYQRQALEASYGDAVTMAFAGETLSLKEQEATLRQSIALKQLRAQADGLVSEIFVKEGDLVDQGALLGMVRDEATCISAALPSALGEAATIGTAAVLRTGDHTGAACLSAVAAPLLDDQTGQAIRQLTFTPLADTPRWKVGDRVTVEICDESNWGVPLAPIEAISESGRIWVVEDGVATSVKADFSQRNENFVALPESYVGLRVILSPDNAGLTEGCSVKEAKRK
ncbi:MAG: biotin/lipoyl-binding protein [Eubacteriales bacterium]|nr:biotin/lipoyl-binding protein [Eubacteriales bacterium]